MYYYYYYFFSIIYNQFTVLPGKSKEAAEATRLRVVLVLGTEWERDGVYYVPLMRQMGKNLPAMQETRVQFLGQEDSLEKGMATHSSIPWTEEPGRLQSMGFLIGHNWVTNRRRQWHPTPVLLPGKIPWMEEPDGLQSMGSLRVGHDWATSLSLFTFMHWRRKWQSTPVFLPGEFQGRGAWWATVYGVTQSRTWLKRLSSSSSIFSQIIFTSPVLALYIVPQNSWSS